MELLDIRGSLPKGAYALLKDRITTLRPSQEKAVKAGLFEGKNLLVCTPTASGKTFVAELAFISTILMHKKKALYIVPLKALASEKSKEFRARYGSIIKVALTIGDKDSAEPELAGFDLIIATSEKLDSLIRHHSPWLRDIKLLVIDEIHLLNDPGRGPTLEVIITLLRIIKEDLQLIGLSATIGNPEELSSWLKANLVIDDWRPVRLKRGIHTDTNLEFYE